MPFLDTSLTRIGQVQLADGTTIAQHLYGTPDAAAVVEAAGYFNNARLKIKKGDTFQCIMATAGTPILKHYVATAVPATGNVTVAIQTVTAG